MHQSKSRAMRPRPARPPTTPPAMAPVLMPPEALFAAESEAEALAMAPVADRVDLIENVDESVTSRVLSSASGDDDV